MADREEKPTVALDPREVTGPHWPVALATLEQLMTEVGPRALKDGLAIALYRCAHAMTLDGASADLVVEAQRLVDALRHMGWSSSKPVSPSR